ncbi:hypothetical protein BH09ACT1_BH09ACT1_06900 [soil metagenome]
MIIAAILFGAAFLIVRVSVEGILDTANRTLASADLVPLATEIGRKPDGRIDDTGKGSLVYVRSPDGEVSLDSLPDDIRHIVATRPASNEEFTASADGAQFVVVGKKVVSEKGSWALWSARSIDSSNLAAQSLDRLLIVGGLVLLIFFGIASWLLGTAALRPVTRMRLQAETLSGDQDREELPVGTTKDEISALAVTLNAFLARVRSSTIREKQVVSDAAHELRTPLAALKTQLELTHRHMNEPEVLVAQISAAERSVERLSSLATNLLALSRLDAGETENEWSTGDQLANELMEGIDRARLLGMRRKIEVSYDSELNSPSARYRLSGASFSRVIDNLAANAVAAVSDGGRASIDIRDSKSGLDIVVRDNGPGMPEDFVQRAFDRFSRADESRTGITGGSGLGLALVRAICEKAGGTVSLTNSGEGLSVHVFLPNV